MLRKWFQQTSLSHNARKGGLGMGWVGRGRNLRIFPGRGGFGEKGLDESERHSWWEEGVLFEWAGGSLGLQALCL